MPNAPFSTDLTDLAAQAKALAHPARLAILQALAEHGTCICGEVVDVLPLAQSTVSQHLKVLKDAGLVQGNVEGPRTCYCLNSEGLHALRNAFDAFGETVLPALHRDTSHRDTCCCC